MKRERKSRDQGRECDVGVTNKVLPGQGNQTLKEES